MNLLFQDWYDRLGILAAELKCHALISDDPQEHREGWEAGRTPEEELAREINEARRMDRHITAFHNRGNDLEEWSEIRVRKDFIPKGAELVEAYLTDQELIVCGHVGEDDETHNCDAMCCTTLSHVIYRFALPQRKEPCSKA